MSIRSPRRSSRPLPLALLLTPALFTVPAAAQTRADPGVAVVEPRFELVEDRLHEAVRSGQYNGVVAVLEIAGERALEVVHGHRDRATGAALEPDTIFRIFSMTKPVTAVAALTLVDEGRLELDAEVASILPAFEGLEVGVEAEDPETGEPTLARVPLERAMTVRDLFRHTAGLTYGYFARSPVDELVLGLLGNRELTNESLVAGLGELPLKHQPGSRFEYSLASDVLGHVVEVVSGTPLDEFMQERIFDPLGMVDTGFHVDESRRERVSVLYRRRGRELIPASGDDAPDPTARPKWLSGGGGLFSTTEDYLRFCRMLLAGGVLDEARVLEEGTSRSMATDQLEGIPASALMLAGGSFGLGLAVTTRDARRGMNQGATWWGGYAGTSFWIDPKADLIGVFMIQNSGEMQHSFAFKAGVYAALGR